MIRPAWFLRLASVVLCLSATTGCTSLQSVSVSSVPRERARPVSASENNVAFLGIHFDNDFVNELPARLRAQCPGGKVVGMFTKYENTWYVLVADREVTIHGYCVHDEPAEPPVAQRRAKAAPPKPPAPPPAPSPVMEAPELEPTPPPPASPPTGVLPDPPEEQEGAP